MMSRPNPLQRGTALVVSLIMLTLITILVITALNLGAGNFRAVSNAQFRDEAIAAANLAIQARISSTFLDPPVTTSVGMMSVTAVPAATTRVVLRVVTVATV